ncbi:MAG: transposase family protein [Trueperaceae bacterium]|nr:transposase family protein [Trueperaceae bacterium]
MQASRLKGRVKHLYNFTGLTVEQFDDLSKAVEKELEVTKRTDCKARKRAVGGGRKTNLSVEDQVLVILMYYRLYLTQILLGYLFDLDDSNVSRLINKLRSILIEVLPVPVQERTLLAVPEGSKKRISSLEELLEKHPEFKEVLVDATEQEIQKPKDKQKRKDNYSGKKKRHTNKTQITSTANKLIVHLTRSVPGKVSDINLLRGTGLLSDLPPHIGLRVDKGYDGIEKDFPERTFHQPYKARRNKPLDFIQRCLNRIEHSLRFPVEHTIAHLKRFKFLAGIFRGKEESYDDSFLAIAGLHNFRKLNSLVW